MSHSTPGSASMLGRLCEFIQKYNIPLLAGVAAALLAANFWHDTYHHVIDHPIPGLGLSLHFLVNDIFMVLFFGIAAKEITTSCLPGGCLNPFRKAINPLFATLGGVYGPVLVFLGLTWGTGGWDDYAGGWGVPTATDIALAWLVARLVFGATHPAVNFLLLLAVADDAIGLGIIAVAYPDPHNDVRPVFLTVVAAAMVCAYGLRRVGVRHWVPYVLGPGVLSWVGLMSAHLHPALALCFVVPFMPSGRPDETKYLEVKGHRAVRDPLEEFEHACKNPVLYGLFFFAFANAGVLFSQVGPGTWYVLTALLVGKTVGITAFSYVGMKMGFPLPVGMGMRHLVLAGMIAGIGLTVALFVAGEAFSGTLQAEAKMGALLSACIGVVALALGRVMRAQEIEPVPQVTPQAEGSPEPRQETPERELVHSA